MTKDMTTGSPLKQILSFAIPVYIGSIFQQIYQVVNAMMVGRFLGTDALAAVGLTGSVSFLIIGFCAGLTVGFSIPIAQAFGSKDEPELKKLMGTIVVLITSFGLVAMLASTLTARKVLIMMNTPANILDDAHRYLLIIYLGIPSVLLYNMCMGIMRALGDSRTPLIILIACSVTSVSMVTLFVGIFGWGVAGAALAIVLSELLASIACIVIIARKFPMLRFGRRDLILQGHRVSRLLMLGIPVGLQMSIIGIGGLVVQIAMNQLGAVVVAAASAASRLSALISCFYDSMGSTMATYAGQNFGAGKISRLRKGLRMAFYCGLIFTVFAIFVCFVFGEALASLYVNGDNQSEMIGYVSQILRTNSIFFAPLILVNLLRLTLQGLGYGKLSLIPGILEMFGRSMVGLVLIPAFGFRGLTFSNPMAWVLAAAFLVPAYFAVIKRIERSVPERGDAEEEEPSIVAELAEETILPPAREN